MKRLRSESLTSLIPALCAAQAAFGRAGKDAVNSHFGSHYTTLASALAAILPALNANGLALVQRTTLSGGIVLLETDLLHASGEWIGAVYPILPTKSDPQGYGSALSYARRYGAMALCGIAPEDDDGNAASHGPPLRQNGQRRGTTTTAMNPALTIAQDLAADALAADLADAMDDASTLGRLDELAASAKALPASLRSPLRARYLDRRAALRDMEPTLATHDPPSMERP